MLFAPVFALPPLMLAMTVTEPARPDPEQVESRVEAQVQARGEWREGDRLRFGMLKPVTCRAGLLGRTKTQGWALEFTWTHAGARAERLHARVTPEGGAAVANGALTEAGSDCRWAD
jgi:hypothetical protein